MALTVRKGKINRHEKIAQVLLSGKSVSPQEIAEVFKVTNQEAVLYRLSTNIYNIRKDGGIVKVIKTGRQVTGYQLVNFTEFDANGRFKGASKSSPASLTPVAAKATKAVNQTQPAALAG